MENQDLLGSTPENEFFHKLNQEQIAQYRAKLDTERRMLEDQRQKELHWMKCPKCGHDLAEQNLFGVMIDACQSCGGIFLDQGELELLRKADQHEKFFVNLNELIFRRKKS